MHIYLWATKIQTGEGARNAGYNGVRCEKWWTEGSKLRPVIQSHRDERGIPREEHIHFSGKVKRGWDGEVVLNIQACRKRRSRDGWQSV